MSDRDVTADEADEQLEIQTGRRAPFTQVGDWVALAPVSPSAKALYWLLSAHLNVTRGDREVWPSRTTLAAMLGMGQARSIDQYLVELEQLGAIATIRAVKGKGVKGPRRNVYVVHQTQPPGYQGHDSLSGWYRERREARAAQVKSQVREVVRQSASPEQVTRQSAPDMVRQDAPAVVRQTAHEQEVVTEDEVGSKDSSTAPPPRDDVERLCHRLRERMIGNGCKPPTITDSWRTSARLLLDKDERDLDKALNLLDWATADEFWMANVQSMGKFRAQYDRLRLLAIRDHEQKKRATTGDTSRPATTDARFVQQVNDHMQMFNPDGSFRSGPADSPAPRELASANGAYR